MLPESRPQILVVDDEPNLRRVLAAQLARDGYDVHTAEDGRQGLSVLHEHHIDLVVTDLRMPNLDGMGLLREAHKQDPDLPVVMITAHGTVDNAVEALKTGAFDYITKPFDQADVRAVLRKALATRRLSNADARRSSDASAFGLLGSSEEVRAVGEVLNRVADTPTIVLVQGEGGTGRDLVAFGLHQHSARRDKPFIRVNCAAIPGDFIEAELFGFEGGAFAGAVTSKPGRFELASEGTLFLDEVSALPPAVQTKLFRATQEHRFERVGGVRTITADVRLVVGTHIDLKQRVQEGAFMADLFYELNVVPVTLPPLRDRPSDIPQICREYLARLNIRLNKQVIDISDEALRVMQVYGWPGNIRELENVVEHAVLFCDSGRVQPSDLPAELGTYAPGTAPAGTEELGLKEQVREVTARLERQLIQKALEQKLGNVTHAARLLKISRKGLQLKMKELGLRERDDRTDA